MDGNCVSQTIVKAFIFLYLFNVGTVFAAAFYPYCRPHYRPYDGTDPNVESMKHISRATNNFGFVFLCKLESSQNVFISPISMSVLLGMLYNGARNKSAAEIRNTIKFPLVNGEGFKLMLELVKPEEFILKNETNYKFEIASAMLIDTAFDVLDTYRAESRRYFNAIVEDVSFSDRPEETANVINDWVASKTKDKILNAVNAPLEPTTRMFLMNVAYFKGTWKRAFHYENTAPDTFYNDGNEPRTVQMMQQTMELRYGFVCGLQVHVLEIPYGGDETDMVILLPEKRNGLAEVESQLSSYQLKEILFNLRDAVIDLKLPKFRLTDNYDLVPILQSMGIQFIFDGKAAEFGRISHHLGLHVTKATHMSSIDVNEEGSEASSMTMLRLAVRTEPDKFVLKVDRPFLFFIRHKKLDLILFLGRVMKL